MRDYDIVEARGQRWQLLYRTGYFHTAWRALALTGEARVETLRVDEIT